MYNYLIASTDYPTNPGMDVFEPGSTSEIIVELSVIPDDVFETNETYVLTLFVQRNVRMRQDLILMDTVPVVTIVNDDSKLCPVSASIHRFIFTISLFNCV